MKLFDRDKELICPKCRYRHFAGKFNLRLTNLETETIVASCPDCHAEVERFYPADWLEKNFPNEYPYTYCRTCKTTYPTKQFTRTLTANGDRTAIVYTCKTCGTPEVSQVL